MDELLPILNELKPDVDFATETGLIDNAILDSFDIVQLVQQLNDAFDIEIEKTSEKPIVFIKSYHKDENRLIDVGRIYQDEETRLYKVEYYDNCKFHFISIHQGVLDKIYGAFGIKGKEHFAEKKQVTKELFDKFSNLAAQIEDESFLPQFIIHSGRSKPNNDEMPQKQPFLQFAALDHALNDCKYTLTELLYSAHYE